MSCRNNDELALVPLQMIGIADAAFCVFMQHNVLFFLVTFRCITVGASAMQIDPIDRDDYFAKNAEFSTWLRDSKGKFFNEMDSDETRALFGMS